MRPCPGPPSAREVPLRPSFVSLLPGPAAPRRAAPHCCAHVQLVVRDAWHAHPSESGCYRSVVPSVQFVCSSSTRLCVWRSVHCTGSLSWACMLSPSSVSVSVAESAHCALRPVVCSLTFLSLLHRTPAVILRKCRRQHVASARGGTGAGHWQHVRPCGPHSDPALDSATGFWVLFRKPVSRVSVLYRPA